MSLAEQIVWLPKQAVLDLHARALERFGGAAGIRDEGGIDAALARPHQLLAYGDAGALTLFDLAAATGYSILKTRHPFVDGNKRACWFTIFVFLRLNGFYLDVPERVATEIVLAVAAGQKSERDLAGFLADNSYAAAVKA